MKGLICFDTRYGSTNLICAAIKKGMGIDADILNIKDVRSLNYDIIVIGSPIFIGKPMQSVTEFIVNNRSELTGKNIVIFVTCWAAATEYKESATEFLAMLTKDLPKCNILHQRALAGKLLMGDITEQDYKALHRILRRVGNVSEEFAKKEIHWKDARNEEEARGFGLEIISALNKFQHR